MARKRKADKTFSQPTSSKQVKFDPEERFDDSEDEFYAGRDKVLLDDSVDARRRKRLVEQERNLQLSDEEILGYEEEEDGDDDEVVSQDDEATVIRRNGATHNDEDGEDEGESDDENWGADRADYYNADVIETEQDALEEEAEAKRLYQKQLKGMTAADFGFDEAEWAQEAEKSKQKGAVVEKLPEAQLPENVTQQQMLDILRIRYPELEPLAEDFLNLQQTSRELEDMAIDTKLMLTQGAVLGPGVPAHVKRNALMTYLAATSMYFALLSSQAEKKADSRRITAMNPMDLHEHAVIAILTKARQSWDRVKDLNTAEPIMNSKTEFAPVKSALKPLVNDIATQHPEKKAKKSKKVRITDTSDLPVDSHTKLTTNKPKKDKKAKFLDLQTLMSQAQSAASDESDFGDEQTLTSEEAAAKAQKRKSLRFYSSQIAQKANKRGAASREAGGDDDLPHKERVRDRQERLLREAEARGRKGVNDLEALDDNDEQDTNDHRPTGMDDEYYNTLLDASSRKKAHKRARADAYAEAARQGASVYEEETVGQDGKRAITYAIAKNKGLTPKRSKDVRNPRVKKKKKYEEKMKKLGSMRQVYKGGEARGGYAGELTGIKSNIVKSIKL